MACALQAVSWWASCCVARRCTGADLSQNGIGPEGAAVLCQALKQGLSLRSLSLAINRVGDAGARSLASWLAGAAAPMRLLGLFA